MRALCQQYAPSAPQPPSYGIGRLYYANAMPTLCVHYALATVLRAHGA